MQTFSRPRWLSTEQLLGSSTLVGPVAPTGVGSRMKIRHTRAMLNAALDGDLDAVEYVKDERFGFEVPMECPNVPSEVLQPRSTWGDKGAFDATADKLAAMFQ